MGDGEAIKEVEISWKFNIFFASWVSVSVHIKPVFPLKLGYGGTKQY